jgi:hypothetical protein
MPSGERFCALLGSCYLNMANIVHARFEGLFQLAALTKDMVAIEQDFQTRIACDAFQGLCNLGETDVCESKVIDVARSNELQVAGRR